MLHIGCHLSIAKGWTRMGKDALGIGADTFQFFTRNPRGSKARAVDGGDMRALAELMDTHAFSPPLAHASYTMNACSADARLRALALTMMREDLSLLATYLPGSLYTFHPGSHGGQGAEAGIAQIAAMLREALCPDQNVSVLLETMAGQGSEVGARFEEIAAIIAEAGSGKNIGVCLDTCHVFCAGYDIVGDLNTVLDDFDRTIGLDRLRAIHLNDSLNPLGSRKDRHARIGEGSLGQDAIIKLINHHRLCHLPFYLETPNELSGYAKEIRFLREAYRQ